MTACILTFAACPDYSSPVAGKQPATGIGVPEEAAMSRDAVASGFFAPMVCPQWQTGREEPQGSPVLPRYANSRFGLPPSIGVEGSGIQTANGKHIMNSTGIGASALTFQNTTFDIVDHNGDVWLRSPQIAVALGYGRADRVNELYARNSDEFTADMTTLVKLQTEGGEQEVRIFSPRGCYALAMFARTKVAKEFRRWVLDVLESIRKTGQYVAKPYTTGPRDTLTAEQADTLRNMLTDAAKARHPGDGKKQGALLMRGWSKLKAHFKTDYRHIPQAEFAEALSIVARHIAESGELLDVAPTQAQIEAAALAAITKPGARYFVTFHENRHKEQVITLQSIPEDAMVLPVSQMAEILSSPDVCLPTKFYTTLSRACMDVVERRAS